MNPVQERVYVVSVSSIIEAWGNSQHVSSLMMWKELMIGQFENLLRYMGKGDSKKRGERGL